MHFTSSRRHDILDELEEAACREGSLHLPEPTHMTSDPAPKVAVLYPGDTSFALPWYWGKK
jgi:hypothetical protein